MINQEKFEALRQFNLPISQYAITGSGPIGIRGLKEIADIDIIVSSELWDALASKYGVTDTGSVKKIVFPGGLIEAFYEGSFYAAPKEINAPTVAIRISKADIIQGLPFDSLEYVLYYKRKMGREKDLKDILLIEQFLKEKN